MMTGYSFSQVKVWEYGNESMGMRVWEWEYRNGNKGMGVWEWKYGNESMGMSLVLYDYPIAPPVEASKGTLTRHSGLKLKTIQRIHKE